MRMEVVQGTVIGPMTNEKPYAFFSLEGEQIASKWFLTDEEAVAWFERGWPTAFAKGVEMRVYDV